MQFETDKHGNILTKPVVGWTTASLGEVAILLAIHYANTPAEIKTGHRSIQFVLTPQQCLELGEKLTTMGNHLLHPPEAGGSRQ